MNALWKLAAVQMDCHQGNKVRNLAEICGRVEEAARNGARLIAFPECALTGYGFDSKAEAWPLAEPLPGPCSETLATLSKRFNVWVVCGLLERDGERLFNALALVGPRGLAGSYRKVHMPFMGVDRFAAPGDRPFEVFDLGGLRLGMLICYDGGFPEAPRVLALQGADLIVLSTNWPDSARGNATFVANTRALENHVFYTAVNRVGTEAGFHFFGMSRIIGCQGEVLAASEDDRATIVYAEIDPTVARQKRTIKSPGKHEVDRIADRRPDLYGVLTQRGVGR
jgi:predicted amidohydrolase